MLESAGTESRAVQREFELVQLSKDHDLITVKSLAEQLQILGVRPGMTLLVHSSLPSLGWVCGGAPAVILALELILGVEGTLVMPTHTGDLSDPAKWQHPGVPEKWWQQIRDEMPAYSPDFSPTREMGAISECFRKQDRTLRSNHPQVSFAARGKYAGYVTGSHSLEFSMGEGSPLARVYELDGLVLLLGVSHGNSTSIHLAEYRADYPKKKTVKLGAPIYQNGVRQWVWFNDINFDDTDFEKIGADFSGETGLMVSGKVGLAKVQLMPQRQLVDFAVRWMEKNRT
jgi:aminoglycoside 3-N-acetyltransferase